MRTLIVGYGNPTRSDDAVGVVIAERLEEMNFENTEVRSAQQFHVDLLEDFSDFDRIILVDVCLEGYEPSIHPVTPGVGGISSSHHLSAHTLLTLAIYLQYEAPEIYLCQVPGENLSFGENLSDIARTNIEKALQQIEELIKEPSSIHA